MYGKDAQLQKLIKTLQEDFVPNTTHSGPNASEMTSARALEYSAYQLGQINKSLKRLVELLEAQQIKT